MGTNQKQEFSKLYKWFDPQVKVERKKKSNFDKEYILKIFAGLYMNVETR